MYMMVSRSKRTTNSQKMCVAMLGVEFVWRLFFYPCSSVGGMEIVIISNGLMYVRQTNRLVNFTYE